MGRYISEGIGVAIKNDKTNFQSLTDNKELWEEVINSSERSAVLVAGAAFDAHLESILSKYLIQDSGVSKRLVNSTLSNFAAKINTCFCLGLISSDERHDLNLLRDIRNSFAHNLFGCDFTNPDVQLLISSLTLANKTGTTPNDVGIKTYFNINMVMLDKLLILRLNSVKSITECLNVIYPKF
jgi:DNA-binding MltR family transcriptional regulator